MMELHRHTAANRNESWQIKLRVMTLCNRKTPLESLQKVTDPFRYPGPWQSEWDLREHKKYRYFSEIPLVS